MPSRNIIGTGGDAKIKQKKKKSLRSTCLCRSANTNVPKKKKRKEKTVNMQGRGTRKDFRKCLENTGVKHFCVGSDGDRGRNHSRKKKHLKQTERQKMGGAFQKSLIRQPSKDSAPEQKKSNLKYSASSPALPETSYTHSAGTSWTWPWLPHRGTGPFCFLQQGSNTIKSAS